MDKENKTNDDSIDKKDSISINLSLNNKNILDKNSHKKEKRQLLQEKKDRSLYSKWINIKHYIFISTLWLGFIASLIIGFILHFEFETGVTASSIMFSLSFVLFLFSTIYSILIIKIKNKEESNDLSRLKLLNLFPF
jgi:hypothetical protein